METTTQTFTTTAPITAILAIPAGRIHITAPQDDTNRDDLSQAVTTVTIRPADPAKNRDRKLAAQTTAAYTDGTLHITSQGGNRILGSTGAVDITVELPAGSRVEAKTASTQLTTTGPLGDITFDSAQATITIDHAATVNLTTTAGDITIGHLDGDGAIRTVTGDIHVTEAARGALDLTTQTGAITVATAASATLDAATTLGRIRNTLTNTGTPALTIHATTTLGDITASAL